jgi:hypothetical protein
MRAGGKNSPKPRQPGAAKQFGKGGGRTPFTVTPKQATAAMQGRAPQSESPSKSIARKDAKKNNLRGGGKRVF